MCPMISQAVPVSSWAGSALPAPRVPPRARPAGDCASLRAAAGRVADSESSAHTALRPAPRLDCSCAAAPPGHTGPPAGQSSAKTKPKQRPANNSERSNAQHIPSNSCGEHTVLSSAFSLVPELLLVTVPCCAPAPPLLLPTLTLSLPAGPATHSCNVVIAASSQ